MSVSKELKNDIDPDFNSLFNSSSEKEQDEQAARMIMYRFLSEIERVSDQQRGLKAKLATSIGTSKSYITQLFNGDKLVNLLTLAKFEKALGIKFQILACPAGEFDNSTAQYNHTANVPVVKESK
jgi:transcriptional regulator with XRE-family HTH domain